MEREDRLARPARAVARRAGAALALSEILSGFTLSRPLAALGRAAARHRHRPRRALARPLRAAVHGPHARPRRMILTGASGGPRGRDVPRRPRRRAARVPRRHARPQRGDHVLSAAARDGPRTTLWYRHVVARQAKRAQGAAMNEAPGLAVPRDRRARPRRLAGLRDGNAPGSRAGCTTGLPAERWESDWSSQTGACQAGMLHGSDDDMPAFRWWEKDPDRRSSRTGRATRPRSRAGARTDGACSTPTGPAGRTSSPATRRTGC